MRNHNSPRVNVLSLLCVSAACWAPACAEPASSKPPETAAGWRKYENNPVFGGGKYGTMFDATLLREGNEYWMYVSWRPKRSIALVKSKDGIHWGEPVIVLGPEAVEWAAELNRQIVLKRNGRYHMWFTGQATGSQIGYARSDDGQKFTLVQKAPVMVPTRPWEKDNLMCPYVLWDQQQKLYRIWYSGGEKVEPDAIGHATSRDGIHWRRQPDDPIFAPAPENRWEQAKVTACQVVQHGDWHLMFYIGFENERLARIGLARSRDGITGWLRHPANPIIAPGKDTWDGSSCYKPFALFERQQNRWLLWYNGRHRGEQIGLVVHQGEDLGWGQPAELHQRPIPKPFVPSMEALERYVDQFNASYDEKIVNYVPNAEAKDFLKRNVPLLECPDKGMEEIYYFRWWTFRKHLKKTPDGFVITEFLPKVGWSGKHNTISCPAGHHFREGRWLHDPRYLDDYSVFWFRKGGEPRRYSFWAADALYARYLVRPDKKLITGLLDDLVANYRAWERSRLGPEGLFWQIDDRDGMEVSIGGSGYRPTINSYMYGDAVAIAKIARMAGRKDLAKEYQTKAAKIKQLVQTHLWDRKAKFFKVLPRRGRDDPRPAESLADVRELHGLTPWYFNLPDAGYEEAWTQVTDSQGFYAPFGLLTAERRHPRFRFPHGHDCQWNGPSWPFATTVTLVAMANLLNDNQQTAVTRADYHRLLRDYARSQHKDGKPWIAENLDGETGRWIVDKPRSVYYNHSGFCDLVITGLVGLRPRADDVVEVNPLLPLKTWDYFCLDNVLYHGRILTILWDRTGEKYAAGKGLKVYADGRPIAAGETLERVTGKLPTID